MNSFTRPVLLICAGLCAATTAFSAERMIDGVSTTVITSSPTPKAKPDQPGWGYWPDSKTGWLQTHDTFVARTKQGGIDIVFLGDSITQGWHASTTENWAGTPKPLVAVDYGIGGDTTRQLLWRIDQGTLDKLTPKLVVLMIGTNNLYADQNSGTNEEVAKGVSRVIERIQAKTPRARILLLGVLPRQNQYWCSRITKLNELLARNASGDRVRYFDAGAAFTDPESKADVTLYTKDGVHLNATGYEKFTALVKPVIAGLLK